ncbi:type II toxin-antitoxin system RelE/ParE family toxin [Aggregatibacter actinomycetemcomitans]|uniref:type II toxin-antitoxin system RelE/ParE family toxin n=1 Tax=Aggregatibacter actinomycetemcomitans TaxID=714 RepID=UPI0011D44417|nr:type II toxin-antitoxin system RelE/ParE family toxin [Aggregatibacter actinomycetemcomitans]QEH45677.1 type II toxin-antitoxin system RelE/ParE family toxin [Aggregatibacter actinomycetemcomitans]QEH47573.1 type II toxin-antitoxin system RelE/ParE family toxin [Aggregatibacter actinomycetemcomitans]QEH49411.1 type II toxin-antitoxin system RelE/ParE family toxin [Aggregatibacter actinomycetemcomitans]TYA48317.1 type II toxin-antitoxin system RelE/ParE family toxin [Aggregatibacter actinomyc
MYIIEETEEFSNWLENLTDELAIVNIVARIGRAKLGNFGDHKSVGNGVYEMRITKGKGYRIYYARKGDITYLLILGGDKSSQEKDIKNAKALWQQIKNGE